MQDIKYIVRKIAPGGITHDGGFVWVGKNEFEECGTKDFEDGHSVIYFKKILSS